jgi:hypothetical protein
MLPKVANRRERSSRFGRGQDCGRRERKLLPVAQLDDPSIRFQPQALHGRPSFSARSGTKPDPLRLSHASIVGDAR